jgi:tape measure domain-containing protein
MNTETLALVLQAFDRTGPAFRGVTRSIDAMSARAREFNARNDATAGKLREIARAASLSLAPLRAMASGLGGIARMGAQATAATARIATPFAGLAGTLGRLTAGGAVAGLTATFGGLAAGMQKVGSAGLDMNGTLLGAQTALTKLLGSPQAAGRFLGQLTQEAAQSIPTLKSLLPIATQLVQAYGPANLGKVLPTIRAFGDAASIAAGGDTNRMEMALLGFRQMLNRGVAQQEEINQIGENLGVNVQGFLKGAFGTADTEVLAKAGITGMQVADAIVQGMQRQFGGAQAQAARTIGGLSSNIEDAFNALSGTITRGFGERVRTGLESVLRLMQALQGAAGSGLRAAFAATFNTLGDVFRYLVAQVPQVLSGMPLLLQTFRDFLATLTTLSQSTGLRDALLIPLQVVNGTMRFLAENARGFLGWLQQFAPTADGLRLALVNVQAILLTIGQTILTALGVDLKKAMDPRNFHRFGDVLMEITASVIGGFFGLGRVFTEVKDILVSGVADARNAFTDWLDDTSIKFKTTFADARVEFHTFLRNMVRGVVVIVDALNRIEIGGKRLFNMDTTGLDTAQAQQERLRKDAAQELRGITGPGGLAERNRQFRDDREAQRDREDPLRHMDPTKRIAQAFSGQIGDMGPQEEFTERLRQNKEALWQRLFGNTGMEGIVIPSPPPPPPAPTVTTLRPDTPAPAFPVDPRLAAAQARSRQTPYQLALSTGGTALPGMAGTPAARQVPFYAAGAQVPSVTVNAPVTVQAPAGGMAALLQSAMADPAFRKAHETWLQDYLQEWAYRQSQIVQPGPSYP